MQNTVITLVTLLQKSGVSQLPNNDVSLSSMTDDSRQVVPGALFLAYPGETSDGRAYIQDALDRGAVAVLCEQSGWSDQWLPETEVPIIPLRGLRERAGEIAADFYGNPSNRLTIIGVTGTNGKTTCTHLLAQLLCAVGHPCAVIGTLGTGALGNLTESKLTTPGAVALQRILYDFVLEGFTHVAMEVSSIGVVLHRIKGINFSAAVFTNLSQDHLDFHTTMENYGEAKLQFFLIKGTQHIILNTDDPFSFEIQKRVAGRVPITWYGLHPEPNFVNTKREYLGHSLKLRQTGLSLVIKNGAETYSVTTRLVGAFNASNVLAVFATLASLKIPLTELAAAFSHIHPVPGRMERWGGGVAPGVVIDYAHTPDALEKALVAARAHCRRFVWCIIGCGGNRDPLKRPLMARMAELYADKVIFTNDNPRHESPDAIIQDMLQGVEQPDNIKVELSRKDAIYHALRYALPDDIIVVAGKGHETYQIIGDEVFPFSDRQVVKEGLYEIHSLT